MPTKSEWSVDSLFERLKVVYNLIESEDSSIDSVFTQLFIESRDTQHQTQSDIESPLAGAIVSVKDLFDVKGYVTRAGSLFMADNDPAIEDADAIKRLREAGATLVGHTNMTELAYSGLGINPHYGTPPNSLIPDRIPGGSTSGGAVSVAKGFADIAIGTDTGGSLRIPAAFNGIVGFKPTQRTISRKGCKALSQTLDSVGPMARTVEACELAYRVMTGLVQYQATKNTFSLVIPKNYGLDDMDTVVARAFDAAVSRLSESGFNITEQSLDSLGEIAELPVWHFAAVESRAEYDHAYRSASNKIDPHIYARMSRADSVDAVTYRETINHRERLVRQYRREMENQVLLLPTVPVVPPVLTNLLNDDAEYNRMNLLALRNPSIANVMDCCSISLPFTHESDTVGIMMTSNAMTDFELLELGKVVGGVLG